MIIDHPHQLTAAVADNSLFVYPILQDSREHGRHTTILGLVLIDTNTKQTYSISNGHPECKWKIEDLTFLEQAKKLYVYDLPFFWYHGWLNDVSVVDVKMQYYLRHNKAFRFDNPRIVEHYNQVYPNCNNIGSLIGLQKHEQIAFDLFQQVWIDQSEPGLDFYQNIIQRMLWRIEASGLFVDSNLFDLRFGSRTFSKRGTYCYTQYNLYTSTGRPSNRFDGINFAALNKEDDTRSCFVSRYGEEGFLLEVDFNAYHPRLLASLIDYDFGDRSPYQHFAGLFNQTDHPTAVQVSEAKEAVFRQLYGGVQRQYKHIPFFQKTDDLSKALWKQFVDLGWIESPVSGRRFYRNNNLEINRHTLLNYFIQMYETELNAQALLGLFDSLRGKDIVPVLYTYDSVLFDLRRTNSSALCDQHIPQHINLSKFPIKIKTGSSYKNLIVQS